MYIQQKEWYCPIGPMWYCPGHKSKNEWSQNVQSWYWEWPWHILKWHDVILGYPKVIPNTKFEHFGTIYFLTYARTDWHGFGLKGQRSTLGLETRVNGNTAWVRTLYECLPVIVLLQHDSVTVSVCLPFNGVLSSRHFLLVILYSQTGLGYFVQNWHFVRFHSSLPITTGLISQ